jgi:diguanylate cyclase (GGDEF)-like protein
MHDLAAPEPPVRVLVAEDSTTVRRLVVRILSRAGFAPIEAVDGIDALTTWAVERPEVALLDLEMPGADGLEVLRRMQAADGLRHTQVLLLTGVDRPGSLEEAFALGALDYVRKPCQPAELVARVRRAVGVRLEAEELRRRSVTDELTGLPNRRGLRMAIEALETPAAPMLAVAVIDADHFKVVNDTWGHAVGDVVLRTLAARLRSAWPLVQLGRWGGEEFLAICPVASVEEAVLLGERLRSSVAAAPVEPGDGVPPLDVRVSIGLAVVPRGSAVDPAIEAADLALYDAKEQGRDRVVLGSTSVSAGRAPADPAARR